jgi:Fe-S cluster assembly scaffold protein SufB
MQTLTVNHLPVPTWNRLDMNRARMDAPDRAAGAEIASGALPEGVKVRRVSQSEAAAELYARAPALPAGEAQAAGKAPAYSAQNLQTGLGADADVWLAKSGAPVDIYTVPPGTKAAAPLVLRVRAAGDSAVSQLIFAGEDSEFTLACGFSSAEDEQGFFAASTRVVLSKGAKVKLVRLQTLGGGIAHFDDIGAYCGAASEFSVVALELGGGSVWAGAAAAQDGDGSAFRLDLGYLGRGGRKLDFNYDAVQRGKKTDSRMNVHGVLADSAQKLLRATIDFRRGSAGSTGDEQEDTLLLSPAVVNRTIPLILCEEENVEGRHGATIGKPSEETLFYMLSRGIPRREAELMLLRARLQSVSRLVPDDGLRGEAEHMIREALQ